MTTTQKPARPRAPLSEPILTAVAKLVDDDGKRAPSHFEIRSIIERAGLTEGDPAAQGERIGKCKRVRATLRWALEHDLDAGEELVAGLIAIVQGCGGFRLEGANYVGAEPIRNAAEVLRAEGFVLADDGHLAPTVLDGLSGRDLTQALNTYVMRAKRGVTDAALLVGTGKDLIEATAAHVLTESEGDYDRRAKFPALLYKAFKAVDLATSLDKPQAGEMPLRRVDRALYELGCSVNSLRNKEGTGHGRPWVAGVTDPEGRVATESIGVVAEYLLTALDQWKARRAKAGVSDTFGRQNTLT